jgi:nitroreductase
MKGMMDMDVFEAMKTRRSIRAYKDLPVSQESLDKVLEAARIAPTAANRQEFKFIVVRDPEKIKALVPMCNNQDFVGESNVVIVGCATNPKRRFAFVDVAIALDHMTLAARAEGLGTCWIGAFSEPEVKNFLEIPDNVSIVCLLTLGVPNMEGVWRGRKPKEELFCLNRWE